jgi:hypothetical protein
MRALFLFALLLLVLFLAGLASGPAMACTDAQARDLIRAQERQARASEELVGIERDRARAEDRARRNAS